MGDLVRAVVVEGTDMAASDVHRVSGPPGAYRVDGVIHQPMNLLETGRSQGRRTLDDMLPTQCRNGVLSFETTDSNMAAPRALQ